MRTRLTVLLPSLAVLAALVCGCDGSKLPSPDTIFRISCAAATEHALLPPGARVLPMDKSVFSIGKNAARVDLAYEIPAAGGATAATAHYSICLKRVAIRWEFERAYPTPSY